MFSKINIMGKILDVKLKRHELLSNNLANVDTPGYKRSDISFEDKLKDYLSRTTIPLVTTNAKHINTKSSIYDLKPEIFQQDNRSFRNDQNNVDVEREMVELTKNTFSYNIIADQIQNNFKILQTAISEGRK